VDLLADEFVHFEHVQPVYAKHLLHRLVAQYLTLVLGVLEIVCFDVVPELLDKLRTGELVGDVSVLVLRHIDVSLTAGTPVNSAIAGLYRMIKSVCFITKGGHT
jgi:hypothetical protein